jgi:hypothetical protein
MSEVPLAHKYSAQTYDDALSNLVERWKQRNDSGPVKYKQAAIGMDESTVSVALKFLGEIGLLEVPKAGSYVVPDDVVDYKTKMGEVKLEAKRDIAERLKGYVLYEEALFMLGLDEFDIEELAESLSGSSSVAAEKDELSDVKRSLNILAELGFLQIDDEGSVTAPVELDGASESGEQEELDADNEEDAMSADEKAEQATNSVGTATDIGQSTDVAPSVVSGGSTRLSVDMDISMDVTEMETQEVRDKLEVIEDILGENEA